MISHGSVIDIPDGESAQRCRYNVHGTNCCASRFVMQPDLNVQRAVFVFGKIDEVLAWDKTQSQERDLRFVDPGRYLCEVRAGQYWRIERKKSFDEVLEKRFPTARRMTYHITAIYEHLPRVLKQQLGEMGWTKARELAKVARRRGSASKVHPGCTKLEHCRTRSAICA